MKKYLHGCLAIVLAILLNACTKKNVDVTDLNKSPSQSTSKTNSPDGVLVNYYWFYISGAYLPAQAPLKVDATYLSVGSTPPTITGCSSPNTYQCVSGFTVDQIEQDGSSYKLKDDLEVPVVTSYRKT